MAISEQDDPPNEPGYFLGAILIIILVALFVAAMQADAGQASAHSGKGRLFLGIYTLAWGFMFLASYFYSHKTFFLRGLVWVCERMSFPASRKMAFFYFALALFLGGLVVLQELGLAP